jgi:hypothetical protein
MTRILVVAVAALLSLPAAAQPAAPPADWKDWAPLIGEWEADAAGPGGATGSFVLALELEGRVLVRKNHADYPKTSERPASRHEDLMVIYREGDATKAAYWDNEGHVIRYVATADKGKSFSFVSEPAAGQPRFRLSYALTSPKALSLRFEIAPPNTPDQFKPYIQATLHRTR